MSIGKIEMTGLVLEQPNEEVCNDTSALLSGLQVSSEVTETNSVAKTL